MSDSGKENEGTPRRGHVTSLPSDYSDVTPKNYDPEFITQISSKMQVPYSIGANDTEVEYTRPPPQEFQQYGQNMMVPDRILVAGEGRHVAAKEGLRPFQFDTLQGSPINSYVGLLTPPRTLTLEEALPALHDDYNQEEDEEGEMNMSQNHPVRHMPNGSAYAFQPEPYTPGTSMNDSLIHRSEQDLHVAVSKLSRRVKALEEDAQRRWLGDMILYFFVGGTVLKSVLGWLLRSRD